MHTSFYYLLKLQSEKDETVTIVQLSDGDWCDLRYVMDAINNKQFHSTNLLNPITMYLSEQNFETYQEAKDYWVHKPENINWEED